MKKTIIVILVSFGIMGGTLAIIPGPDAPSPTTSATTTTTTTTTTTSA